jgi:hypothetical protein
VQLNAAAPFLGGLVKLLFFPLFCQVPKEKKSQNITATGKPVFTILGIGFNR